MAAPHVAGIVALLLDANPTLTPLRIKELLQATATPMPYATWEVGAGYVNAYAAVTRAFK
jgi:serine protease AprX